MNSAKSPDVMAALEQSISRERLGKYLVAASDDLSKALDLYEKNCRLSEAFYTPLQCLEVCFRNSLNAQLTNYYGTNWFRTGGPPLHADAEADINHALKELERNGTVTALPGAVVAELKLGFWVSLIAGRYDATLWRQCLHKAFSKPAKSRGRKHIHGRFNALRRFRNRVAHHEPIFHLDPAAKHAEIVEAIEWMCPTTAGWATTLSRVNEVHGA